jgi:hypothetical protein
LTAFHSVSPKNGLLIPFTGTPGLIDRSDAVQVSDCPFVLHVARIQRRGRPAGFLVGDGPVIDATGDDQELAFFDPDVPISKLQAEAAFHDEE